jgi:hypothetical protein
MKRRTILILVIVACLALAAPVVISWLMSGSRIDQEHFDAIQVGMSRAEVERLLGGAPRNEISGHAIIWIPRGDSRVSHQVLPGEPLGPFFPNAPEGTPELVWLGEKGLIAVHLGEDGRVADKYFSTVHDLDESTVRRIFRKFDW